MKSAPAALYQSELTSLTLLTRGKVRDIYAVDDEQLLIVATDRLSAFDVILTDPIPGKGAVLTELSAFWFGRTGHIIRNHLSGRRLEEILTDPGELGMALGRSVVVRRLRPLPVEAVVRGYLIGSGWKDYQQTGTISGIRLPPGLEQAAQLPQPIFTPATKAAPGAHDENISFDQAAALIGRDLAVAVREASVRLYQEAAAYARGRGIIIADTKFEFGVDRDGALFLIDEALTPDSSRFWPADSYRTGISPPSFDKQYVRDYLETLDWDKRPPAPRLPAEVIARTAAKYREARDRLLAEGNHHAG